MALQSPGTGAGRNLWNGGPGALVTGTDGVMAPWSNAVKIPG
jgi:hypothetical protein